MIYVDKNLNSPLYQQIYAAIKMEIILRIRREGEKLPSIRALAKELGVSATTVVEAYEMLCSEGYVVNRRGSGHYVCRFEPLTSGGAPNLHIEDRVPEKEKQYRYHLEYGRVDRNDIPMKRFRKMVDRSLLDIEPTRYASYERNSGLAALQGSIAYYLNITRGVICSPEQILIGSTTQQLLEVAAKILKYHAHITSIAVEDPGNPRVRAIFEYNDFRVSPISVGEHGIDLEELKESDARVVCVTPGHQLPTGTFVPIQNRLEILYWARRHKGFVIEDDSGTVLRYRNISLPSMQGLDDNDCVIYCDSTSRIFAPGLGLSYMVLPKCLLAAYEEMFKDFHGNVSNFFQRAYYYFMVEGFWENHIKKIVTVYARKHDRLTHLLSERLSPDFVLKGTGAGLHFLVESLNGMTEEEMIRRAAEKSVEVFPVSPYWIRKDQYTDNQVILGFASLSLEELVPVADLLQEAWMK